MNFTERVLVRNTIVTPLKEQEQHETDVGKSSQIAEVNKLRGGGTLLSLPAFG